LSTPAKKATAIEGLRATDGPFVVPVMRSFSRRSGGRFVP
jgi:hypothetical protein